MLKKVGIRGRMILLTIVPTMTVSILLGFYFISMRFSDLNRNLYIRGEAIATELVAASEYGLYLDNKVILQNVTDSILSYPDIIMAAVYDVNGQLLTFTGRIPQLTQSFFKQNKNLESKNILHLEGKNSVQFVAPVITRSLNLEDAVQDNAYMDINQRIGWVGVTLSRQRTALNQYQAIIATLLIVLIGLTVSILFGLRLGGDLINPLFYMINAVKRIRDGNLNVAININSPGEMQVLEEGINSMAFSLKNSHQEMQKNIEKATENLRKTLQTIEIQNKELNVARKEAIEASQIKSKFLANMSHEIRTPMNGILGFLDLLDKSELNVDQQEYVGTIYESSKHLLGVINDILDFSKIESGSLVLEQQPFNIVQKIENSIMLFKPEILNKNLDFALCIDRNLPKKVIGDSLRFSQIITNLTSNALKFTETGGVKVDVNMHACTDHTITLSVVIVDTGVGLSDDQKTKLFHAFTQADLSTSRKYGGTGLGLTITKSLIEKMGGHINVESAPNKGASFSFTAKFGRCQASENIDSIKFTTQNVVVYDQTIFAAQAIIKSLNDYSIPHMRFNNEAKLIDYIVAHQAVTVLFLAYSDLPGLDKLYQSLVMDLKAFTKAHIILFANASEVVLKKYAQHWQIADYLNFPYKESKLINILQTKEASVEISPKLQIMPNNKKLSYQFYQVLVIDDNPINLKLLKIFLENLGLNVTISASGFEALQLAKKQNFDLILTDIQMPEMDGVVVCQKLRELAKYKSTPIVAVTADIVDGRDADLLAKGFDAIQIKPISEEKIAQLVLQFIEKKPLPIGAVKKVSKIDPSKKPLVDLDLGAELAGGNEAFAKEMLQALLASLPKEQQQIEQAYQANDPKQLKAYVHKLHGGCSYCGVPLLKSAAAKLEALLNNAETLISDEIKASYCALINSIEKTAEAILAMKF